MIYHWILILFMPLVMIQSSEKPTLIKPVSQTALSIPEPSDITGDGQYFYIVSDRGMLYKTDLNGKVMAKATFEGVDFEAVCVVDDYVIVVDEGVRQVHYFDRQTLTKSRTILLQNQAATNRGVEGMAYQPEQKLFYLFTEKDPASCFVYNEQWQLVDYFILRGLSDISGAQFHNNKMWLLSDEESALFELDLQTKQVHKRYRLNLINPEGLYFQQSGVLTVCSDDMQKIFNYQGF